MNNPVSPYVSVVVPTLNEANFIEPLLRTLEKQDYRNFETIIVDGGSGDKTAKIANKYGAKTLSFDHYSEFQSRNIGGKVAKGEILLFTSADVMFPHDTIQKVVNEFREDSDLSAFYCSGRLYNAPIWAKIEYKIYYSLIHAWTKILRDYHGSTNFMAVRKSVFEKIGGFPERIDSDGFFVNKLGKTWKVKFLYNESIFISGRRARKMGFLGFNTHFLYIVDVFLPYLRESGFIKILETYATNHRKNQTKQKTSRF